AGSGSAFLWSALRFATERMDYWSVRSRRYARLPARCGPLSRRPATVGARRVGASAAPSPNRSAQLPGSHRSPPRRANLSVDALYLHDHRVVRLERSRPVARGQRGQISRAAYATRPEDRLPRMDETHLPLGPEGIKQGFHRWPLFLQMLAFRSASGLNHCC